MPLLNTPRRRRIANIVIACCAVFIVADSMRRVVQSYRRYQVAKSSVGEDLSAEQILAIARKPFPDDFSGDEAVQVRNLEQEIVDKMAALLDGAEQGRANPERYVKLVTQTVLDLTQLCWKRNELTNEYNATHGTDIEKLTIEEIRIPLGKALRYRSMLSLTNEK